MIIVLLIGGSEHPSIDPDRLWILEDCQDPFSTRRRLLRVNVLVVLYSCKQPGLAPLLNSSQRVGQDAPLPCVI